VRRAIAAQPRKSRATVPICPVVVPGDGLDKRQRPQAAADRRHRLSDIGPAHFARANRSLWLRAILVCTARAGQPRFGTPRFALLVGAWYAPVWREHSTPEALALSSRSALRLRARLAAATFCPTDGSADVDVRGVV